jgi:hypothetical protein
MSYKMKMVLPVVGVFLPGRAVVAAVRGEGREHKRCRDDRRSLSISFEYLF